MKRWTSTDSDFGDIDRGSGAGQKNKASAGAECICQQSIGSNGKGANRPAESNWGLHARFGQSAPVPLFSKTAQMPTIDAIFLASNMCKGKTTKSGWSYTLQELNGTTKVTVQPVWEYPDDYCEMQTKEFIWGRPEEIAAFQAMLDKAITSNTQPVFPPPATPTSSAGHR